MAEYGTQQSGFWDKAIPAFCVMVLIATLISIPFMVRDKEERLEKQWQPQGCQMYDNDPIKDVPVKCLNEFVDHYKGQEQRVQPPEAK